MEIELHIEIEIILQRSIINFTTLSSDTKRRAVPLRILGPQQRERVFLPAVVDAYFCYYRAHRHWIGNKPKGPTIGTNWVNNTVT